MYDACQSRSVRCPCRGNISKTKQDRHIVTNEHYTLYYTRYSPLILLTHSNHPKGAACRDILVSSKNKYIKMLIQPPVRM